MSLYDRMLPFIRTDGAVGFQLIRDFPVATHRRMGPRGRKGLVARVTGEAEFEFSGSKAQGTRQLRRVSLQLREGMTGSDLRRFPWTTLTNAAEALDRGLYKPERGGRPIDALAKVHRRHGRQTQRLVSPGRKGLGRRFYKEVADRFLELRAAGERAPIQVIAKERHASPDTVKTWIRKAREFGSLPPGRS